MIDFFFRHIYRTKFHLLYAAFAQIVLMGINVLILLSSNFEIPYTIFQSIVPTYFYLIFIVLFYLLIGKLNRNLGDSTVFSSVLNLTIIVANVVYTLITTFDDDGVLYYLDTVIVQTINAFYMMIYVSRYGHQYAFGNQMNLLKIFSYAAVVAALLAFYFCFVNILVAWICIIITTVLMFFTYLMLHENYKRSLPKQKQLRHRSVRPEN